MDIFRYRHRFPLKLLLLILFIVFPFPFDAKYLFLTWYYYSVMILVQTLLIVFTISRKLILNDEGITEIILWKIKLDIHTWNEIEEAHYIEKQKSSISGINSDLSHDTLNGWFSEMIVGDYIKFIISNNSPFYIYLNKIINPNLLVDIIEKKVKFL